MLSRRKFLTTTFLVSAGALSARLAFAQLNVGSIISDVVSSTISNAISNTVQEVLGAEMFVAPEKVAAMTAVAIEKDGGASAAPRMVTSHDDGSVALWDLREGRQVKRIENLHEGPVTAVGVSESGGVAVSAGQDGKAHAISTSSGKVLSSMAPDGGSAAVAVAVSKTGKTAVTGHEDGSVHVWDTQTGTEISASKPAEGPVNVVALSQDETQVLVGDASGGVAISDAKTGKIKQKTTQAHDEAVTFIQEHPGGAGYITAGKDGRVKSWQAEGDTAQSETRLDAPVTSATIDPKSGRLAAGDDKGNVRIVEIDSGEVKDTISTASGDVGAVAFGTGENVVHTVAADGTMSVVSADNKEQPTRVVTTTEGWAAVDTVSGAYVGDGDALTAVGWATDDLSFELDQFGESHYEPGVLALASDGQSIAPVTAAAESAPQLSTSFGNPPIVNIAEPGGNETSDREDYELQVEAGDLGGGLREIRLFHNERMVAKEAVDEGEETYSHTFDVKLSAGANNFRVIALSRDMIESKPAKVQVTYTGAERKSILHVVTIGINDYRNPALSLNYGVPDAQGLEQFFASQPRTLFKDIKTYEVFNKDATKPGIRQALARLESVSPDDVLVVYLAGHGDTIGDTWYFLPYDVVYPEREDHVKAKGITSEELEGWINDVPAQKVVVLIDACKSGAALSRNRGFEERKALCRLSRASGIHIIAAAAKDQFAVELEQLGHGAFTYTLLDGLSGAADDGRKSDGVVNIREINRYVEEELPELSERSGNVPQFPVISSRGSNFPLAVKV